MADMVEISILYDFYGMMLTENQQRCLELYYSHDMSFAEIAEELGVSRQGVYDAIKRGRNFLEEYEEKLGLAARFYGTKERLEKLYGDIGKVCEKEQDGELKGKLEKVKQEIESIVSGL